MRTGRLMEFEYIFNPRSVAVIGASEVDNFTPALVKSKIGKRLFLVNPKHKEIFGKKCYSSLLEIEDEIDYVVIAVPAPLVPKVLRD